ncbi:hypothetical protein ANO11243_092890 [Dothideomycetidae sp. 11243]|nr:hypothetical protein ANO11243_092890 [fungal sp. No.11243]
MKLLGMSAMVAALAVQVQAAVNVYMTVADANGNNIGTTNSQTTLIKNAIEIQGYSFGTEQTINLSSQSSGAGAGKIHFDAFTLSKTVDANTPVFFNRMAQGLPNTITIYFFKVTGGATTRGQQAYMTWQFRTAAFSAQSFSGDEGDDGPRESLSFQYGALQISYTPTKTDGTPGTPTASGWNSVKNTAEVQMVSKGN